MVASTERTLVAFGPLHLDSDHRPALTPGTEKTTVPFPRERAEEKQTLLSLARETMSSTKSAQKATLVAPSRGTLDLSLASVAPKRQVWLRWHRQAIVSEARRQRPGLPGTSQRARAGRTSVHLALPEAKL
jgi:hypothetical protein